MDYIFTDNKGRLTKIEPFFHLRGEDSKGELMGKAKDDDGNIYEVYVAPCSLPTCYCFATAKLIKEN